MQSAIQTKMTCQPDDIYILKIFIYLYLYLGFTALVSIVNGINIFTQMFSLH